MANAGAEPPLIWRRGEFIKPRVEGVPIGLLEDREYERVGIDHWSQSDTNRCSIPMAWRIS